MHLKDVLGQIQSDCGNLFHGRRLLEWLATPPLWHVDAVGGVHPINLSSHKRAAVRELIKAAGANLMFLPPYSPDFNPIEKAFARLKALLRRAAERTVSGLWDLIGRLVDLFQPSECANYFSSCGYDPE